MAGASHLHARCRARPQWARSNRCPARPVHQPADASRSPACPCTNCIRRSRGDVWSRALSSAGPVVRVGAVGLSASHELAPRLSVRYPAQLQTSLQSLQCEARITGVAGASRQGCAPGSRPVWRRLRRQWDCETGARRAISPRRRSCALTACTAPRWAAASKIQPRQQ